jgi:hypothetical protein
MKPYLSRLVARAAPAAEMVVAVSPAISDPFAETAEAGMELPAAAPAPPDLSPRPTQEHSPLLPPGSAPSSPESGVAQPSEAPVGSLSFTDRPPAISVPPILPKPSAEESGESPRRVAGAKSTLAPRPGARRPDPRASNPDEQSPGKASEAGVKETAKLQPREIASAKPPEDARLLEVADRFIEDLRTRAPEAARAAEMARATRRPVEVSQSLAPRGFPGSKAQPSQTESAVPSAASLHIGNLQVDIVEANAASAGRDKSPAPIFIVRDGPRDSRSSSGSRQRFGLRQL